jgi:hypothetical protein
MVCDPRRWDVEHAFRNERHISTETDCLILELAQGVGSINHAAGILRYSQVSNGRAVDNVPGYVCDSHLFCPRRKHERGAGCEADQATSNKAVWAWRFNLHACAPAIC